MCVFIVCFTLSLFPVSLCVLLLTGVLVHIHNGINMSYTLTDYVGSFGRLTGPNAHYEGIKLRLSRNTSIFSVFF